MNGKLDVEVHNGRVVAVWHHCQLLPFEQIDVDDERAAQAQNPDAIITEHIEIAHYNRKAVA